MYIGPIRGSRFQSKTTRKVSLFALNRKGDLLEQVSTLVRACLGPAAFEKGSERGSLAPDEQTLLLITR